MFFIRLICLCALSLSVPLGATAQTDNTPLFDNYLALRATLDTMMKNRDIAEVMAAFGNGSMSAEELEDLEARVRSIFPKDFENVAMVRKQELAEGWRQEMIAYWTGINYIYVMLLLHQRDDGLLALNMKFNTEFGDLFSDF